MAAFGRFLSVSLRDISHSRPITRPIGHWQPSTGRLPPIRRASKVAAPPHFYKIARSDTAFRQKPAANSQQPKAILRLTFKAVYRHPFTVHRLSHRMTGKVLTHGSRRAVTRSAVKWTPQWPAAKSQQPEAISRLTFKAVYRHPFTVHRLSHLMTNKALTHGSRLHGRRSAASTHSYLISHISYLPYSPTIRTSGSNKIP